MRNHYGVYTVHDFELNKDDEDYKRRTIRRLLHGTPTLAVDDAALALVAANESQDLLASIGYGLGWLLKGVH